MKDVVLIKSFPNGISIRITDEECPFSQILEELCYKFSQARAFFKNASVALSIEGRSVTDTEELLIVNAIRQNSDLHVVCIIGKDEEKNGQYVKALQGIEEKLSDGSEGQFYKGSLKNSETLETDGSIVILGDVYPGSAVVCAKNIIVLGGLYGEAYAGMNGQEDAFVAALEMEPEKLKIGDFKYRSNKQPKWGIRPKVQPKIAYLKDKKVIMDNLTKEILSHL